MKSKSDLDLDAWSEWMKMPGPITQANLLKRIEPMVVSEVNKLTGLSATKRIALKAKAKTLALEALKKFDPSKAQLNTYLLNQLMKLKRFAYEHAGIARIPENRQLKIRDYKNAIAYLETELQRDPSDIELADYLNWPVIEITKMKAQLRSEIASSSMLYNPATHGLDDKLQRKIDIIYDSLTQRDKDIFDYTIGAHGKLPTSNNDIAEKLNISPALVSQRKNYITDRLQAGGISRYSEKAMKQSGDSDTSGDE